MSPIVVQYPPVQTVRTKVFGVSFRNADGTPRQSILRTCRPGDRVFLVREPANRHDTCAVAVVTAKGEQLGYIGSHRAHNIAREMDEGRKVSARITQLTGGTGWWLFRRYHGANLELTIE